MKITHPISGQKLEFQVRSRSSDSKAVNEIFNKKIYLKPSIGFTVEPDDVWADLGGNIGAFSVFAGSICKQVYCFEPEPNNLQMIDQNLRNNRLKNVHVTRGAVMPASYKKESVILSVCQDPNHFWMHTVFATKRSSRGLNVPAVNFARMRELGVNAIKMDIEGAEIPILSELPDLSWVEKFVFEWSFDKDPRIKTLRDVLSHLRSQFEVVSGRELPAFTDVWNLYPPATNYFCMKKARVSPGSVDENETA